MTRLQHLTIAVVGDEDLVNGMRLVGISRYCLIEGNSDVRTDVRRGLTELVRDPEIGIIIILEEYTEHADDLIAGVRGEKSMTPVIVEVPSKYGTKHEDIGALYRAYIKHFIGFEMEI
ncbi:MAG: V-type ATP synthase subunit F [Dehalococcoidia bacterium]|nr:V-type ATP synthase subunit F [Dehalococcoidia bacterium]MCL0058941.1 V-type ATP synthase subunit F [Dehalococcoidia bacterium]